MKKAEKSKLVKDINSDMVEIEVTLEYSIRLLEDYQGDLIIELKDLKKLIRSSKAKLKKLKDLKAAK